jgi:phosphotransferase system enzyme I (PtsI)
MASDPVLAPLLIGLGVDELSTALPLLPSVKFIIRRMKISEARELADFALNCENAGEILCRCQELARQIAPGLFEDE